MAEPPRLGEIKIPSGTDIIYFVTICVDGRRDCLANPIVFEAIRRSVDQLRKWNVLAGVVMPDHVHLVVTPIKDRGLSIGDFSAGLKKLLRKQLVEQTWNWQRSCFDRLLRSGEDVQKKWTYVEQNPVRAGLVTRVQDWPYYLGSLIEDGKLTASPTGARGEDRS